jgi:hypothetical protein
MVEPNVINAGDQATLKWEAEGADSVSISGFGTVSGNSYVISAPSEGVFTYTATARGRNGETKQSNPVALTVRPKRSAQFNLRRITVTPQVITPGQSFTVTAEVQNSGESGRCEVNVDAYRSVPGAGASSFPVGSKIETVPGNGAQGSIFTIKSAINGTAGWQVGSYQIRAVLKPSNASDKVGVGNLTGTLQVKR